MSDLPSGTVTFLFTDIEGSTALWEQDHAAMRLAVDRHLELLDAAIAAHDGFRFQIIGDALQVAFAAAPDALAAAVEAQRAIIIPPLAPLASWGRKPSLVRVGLDPCALVRQSAGFKSSQAS